MHKTHANATIFPPTYETKSTTNMICTTKSPSNFKASYMLKFNPIGKVVPEKNFVSKFTIESNVNQMSNYAQLWWQSFTINKKN